jgi:hypothetical protein
MGANEGIRDESIDRVSDPSRNRRGDENKENRLTWEFPLGVVRGYLDEPGPRFVDIEGEADKEACRLERGGLL